MVNSVPFPNVPEKVDLPQEVKEAFEIFARYLDEQRFYGMACTYQISGDPFIILRLNKWDSLGDYLQYAMHEWFHIKGLTHSKMDKLIWSHKLEEK